MKISQNKSRRMMTVGLAILLTALLSFSLLPLVGSVLQAVQSRPVPGSPLAPPVSPALASEVMGYELVVQREPDNLNAWRGLLEAQLRQGKLAEAIAPLEKLTQLDPQNLEYGLLLAQTQAYLKNEEGAIATYQGLLANHPTHIPLLKGLVDLYLAQQRPQAALQLLQTTLALAREKNQNLTNSSSGEDNSTLTSLQLLLGEVYGGQDREQEAIALYSQAINDNPQDFRPLLAKALLLQKQGKTSEAEPLWTSAIALAPVQYKDEIKKLAVQTPVPATKSVK